MLGNVFGYRSLVEQAREMRLRPKPVDSSPSEDFVEVKHEEEEDSASGDDVRAALASQIEKSERVSADAKRPEAKGDGLLRFAEDVELAMPMEHFQRGLWIDPNANTKEVGHAQTSTVLNFIVFDDEKSDSPGGYEYGAAPSAPTVETAPEHRKQLYRYGLSECTAFSAVAISAKQLQMQSRKPGKSVFGKGQFIECCDYGGESGAPPVSKEEWDQWHRCNRYNIEVARTWFKLFDDMEVGVKEKMREMSGADAATTDNPMILAVTELGSKGALFPGELADFETRGDEEDEVPQLRRSMTWPLIMPSMDKQWEEYRKDVSANNRKSYDILAALFSEDVAADYDTLWENTPKQIEALVEHDDPNTRKWEAWKKVTGVFQNLASAMPFWAAAHLHMGLVKDDQFKEEDKTGDWGCPEVAWYPYSTESEVDIAHLDSQAVNASTWAQEQLHRCILGFYGSPGVPQYECGESVAQGSAAASELFRKWFHGVYKKASEN